MRADDWGAGLKLNALRDWAHLAALWSLAVVQPQLSLLRSGQEFTLAGWGAIDVLLYSLALTLVPPTVMLGAEVLAGRIHQGWRRGIHLVLVGSLVAALAGYAIKRASPDGSYIFALALLAGVVAGALYAYREEARTFVGCLVPAPILVLLLFLVFSPTSSIVFPGSASAPEQSPRRATPLVLIVFDEFPTVSLMNRHGDIDAGSYPHFAKFTRGATWYRNAVTASDFTQRAVPAILTGTHPGDAPPSAAGYPNNLFTLMAPSHRVVAHEVFPLCPEDVCPDSTTPGFPDKFTKVLPAFAKVTLNSLLPNRLIAQLPEPNPLETSSRLEPFSGLRGEFRTGSRPAFFFVHAQVPHTPWNYLPSGKEVIDVGCCARDILPEITFDPRLGFPQFLDDTWTSNTTLVRRAQQAHLAMVGFVDRLLGRVIRRLRDADIYRRSMIVVTADHGISFLPGENHRRLTDRNAAAILGVPLFVKLPYQQRGGISERHTQTIDVVPTISQVMGVDLPWSVDGESMVETDGPDRKRVSVTPALGGEQRVYDLEDLDRRRLSLSRLMDRTFGRGRLGVQLYDFGPRRDLLGRSLRSLPTRMNHGLSASIEAASSYSAIDLRASSIPTAIAGALSSQVLAGSVLAIAVNGRIAATTRAYRSIQGIRFGALLPPQSLRQGVNQVRILASPKGHPSGPLLDLGGVPAP